MSATHPTTPSKASGNTTNNTTDNTADNTTDNTDNDSAQIAPQLNDILVKQKAAFLKRGFTSYEDRISALSTLQAAFGTYKQRIIDAVMSDFGHRSPHETSMTEVLATMGEIATTKRHLKKWMKHQKAPFSMNTATGTGKILYQPKGVVGIIRNRGKTLYVPTRQPI